jgi:hypothetical protein
MFEDWTARLRAAFVRRVEQRLTEERVVHGFPVVVINTRPEIRTEDVFQRLEAVLDLVARYQPRRFHRLLHDLARIEVRRFPCRAAYFPETRSCLLELTFVVNPAFNEAQIAASLVHEGVHARLRRMGVHVPPGQESREERLCRQAELELGRVAPGGAPVIERALQSLALSDQDVAPSIDWAEASRRVQAADMDALRGRGGETPGSA